MQVVLKRFFVYSSSCNVFYSSSFFTQGGLQIHFVLPSEGAYANFRIVSNPSPSSSSSGSESNVPHVTLQALPLSEAARGDTLDLDLTQFDFISQKKTPLL